MSKTTALLVIDLQKGILRGPEGDPARQAETFAALDAAARRIGRLQAQARLAGCPVFLVQHDGAAGHRLAVGSRGWELRDEIAPQAGELVIHKTACDSFFETGLAPELERFGVQQLVIAGCMTQFCVDTTVRRAVSLGYDVELASDGHMTEDFGGLRFEQIIAHHNLVLDGFDAGAHQARVLPCAEIAF